MPTLADLVTQTELAAYLSDQVLSPAQLAKLPTLAADASDTVRRHCKRAFTAATFDELYTVDTPSTLLLLREFPLISVDRCCTNPTAVLNVAQADTATNQRATVALQTAGDFVSGLVVTGLTLNRWASGVKTSYTVPIDGAHLTVQSLADAVNAYGNGWLALPASGYALWPSADLRGVQGASPALGRGNGVDLVIHVDDLTFAADERTGALRLSSADPYGASSPRFGPASGGEVEDTVSYGGTGGLRVVYTAGFATVPPKVRAVTAYLVSVALAKFRTDPTLKSESDGVLSYTANDMVSFLTRDAMADLSPYVNHRA